MRHTITQRLLSIFILSAPLPTNAAEWSAEPSISLRTGYNDNVRFETGPHDSTWETSLTPAVKFGMATENKGLFGNASASVRRFTGGSDTNSSDLLDREDYQLRVNAYHRTELGELNGLLNLTRDSTLDSQLDEEGIVIQDRATRSRINFSPSWTRLLNEKTTISLSYNLTNVSYSDEIGITDLIEYDYNVFSSSLIRQFTPLIQGTLSASYSNYEPETDLNSETINIQAGLSKNFSETLMASFLVGQRNTTSDTLIGGGFCVLANPGATFPECEGGVPVELPGVFTKGELDTSGLTINASITKILETGSLSASLNRSSSPSGSGELLDRTSLILTGVHNFTETLSSSLSIGYTMNETIVNSSGNESDQADRTLFRVKPKISWHWQPEWGLTGGYEYARSEDINSDIATRNTLYLTLTYRQPKISISR
jgi:hypothetical protein